LTLSLDTEDAGEHCRNAIVVTALEQLESAQEALQLGAHDYVTKPFSLRELDTVLESHTQMSRSTSVAREAVLLCRKRKLAAAAC